MAELKRTERARKNLALKLQLEDLFTPEIESYFNQIVRDFKAFYRVSGETIPRETYEDDTVSLLNKQYKRTSKAFSTELRESLLLLPGGSLKSFFSIFKKQDEIVTEEQDDSINAALILFTRGASVARSVNINDTNESQIRDSVNQATLNLVENDKVITNDSVSDEASKILDSKFDARVRTISMTETGFMAETTKAIEASIIFGAKTDLISRVPPINIPTTLTSIAPQGVKTWVSVLDQVTRDHHVQADGQKKFVFEHFIVNGERMRYPLDPNGSAGNVINCRCTTLYSLK